MKAKITKEIALKAVLLGACSLPEIGMAISKLPTSSLIWAENKGMANREEIRIATGFDLPLWVLYGDGDGYGDGYGDGDGSGEGYGDSYGEGESYCL